MAIFKHISIKIMFIDLFSTHVVHRFRVAFRECDGILAKRVLFTYI